MPDPLPKFQKTQFDFTAYIRDPDRHQIPPDIEPRRMAVYRELLFNNVESFLAGTFPVLKSLFDQDDWLNLVQGYFSTNKSQSPYFTSISEQFVEFLGSNPEKILTTVPFIQELAHYEWLEMVLMLAEGEFVSLDQINDNDLALPESTVRLSNLAYRLVYQFPVHRISPEFQPQLQPDTPTYLVMYRDQGDIVKFMEINAVTYTLLERIENSPDQSCEAHLNHLVELLQHPDPQQAIEFGLSVIKGLLERSILHLVGDTHNLHE